MSKRALWIAAVNDDECSDKLVAIAAEHTRLARKVSDARKRGSLSIKEMSKLIDRIESIRVERELLLKEICKKWG